MNLDLSLPLPPAFQSLLLSSLSEAVIATDPDFNIIRWNGSAERMYGWQEKEVLGKSISDILPTVYLSAPREQVLADFYRLGEWKGEVCQSRKNGSNVYIHTSVAKVMDDQGMLIGLISINRDISRERSAKLILQKKERSLRKAMEIANLGMFEVDMETGRGNWSPELFRIFEFPITEGPPLVSAVFANIHPEDQQLFIEGNQKALETNLVVQTECRYLCPSGKEKYIKSYINRETREDGKLVLNGTVQDITLQKQYEQQLILYQAQLHKQVEAQTEELKQRIHEAELLNQQLQSANRELKQFAFIASHDLQEPLTTIHNFAQLLHRKYPQGSLIDEQAQLSLGFIREGSKRMSQLIAGLMEYSRISNEPVWSELNLNEIVKEVLEDLDFRIQESRASIQIADLPTVLGDSIGIRVLFQNLLTNAIKFRRPNIPPRIRIFAEEDEQNWRIVVKDHGIGIQPEYQEKIFAIFHRLHSRKAFEGTGIGLAQCKKIVDSHKGEIGVDSQPENGSSFWFTLQKTHG